MPPLLSYAVWQEIDRDAGRLPGPEARRLRFLVPLLLLGAAVLGAGGVVRVSLQPPPRPAAVPVFPATDGLPEVLVAGHTYEGTLQVVFPAGWRDGDGGTHAVVMVLGRDETTHIISSAGDVNAPGHTIVVPYRVRASSPGLYVLHVTTGRILPHAGPPDGAVTKSYPHTVRPPTS
jgi:hypothetical protein